MSGRGIVESDSLEILNYNNQNGTSGNDIPRLPLLSGSNSIGSESLDYRGYLDIEFDCSASFSSEQCQTLGSPHQVPIYRLDSQDDASTRTIRPLSLLLNKENPNEISSWICETREEESEGLTHGGWPTHMVDLTPKQSTYCCYDEGRTGVEMQGFSKVQTSYPASREDDSKSQKEADGIPVPKGTPGQSYLLTEMDKRFRKVGTKTKNFNSPLPIQNVKNRHEQEKNFVQANKKSTGRNRVPEETSYCKVLSQRHVKSRPNAFPQKRHPSLPGRDVHPSRQLPVEVQEEGPNTRGGLQHKWLAQASAADLSSMILEQKKQLEQAFDKLMKRIDEQKKTAPERVEEITVSTKKSPSNVLWERKSTLPRPAKAHRNYLKERQFIPPPPGPDCTLGPDFSSPIYKEQMLEYSKRLREIANRKNKPALPREKNTPPEAPNDNSFVVLDSNILNMLKRHEEENQAVLLVADELKSS